MIVQLKGYIRDISQDPFTPFIPVKKNDPDEPGSGTVIAK